MSWNIQFERISEEASEPLQPNCIEKDTIIEHTFVYLK